MHGAGEDFGEAVGAGAAPAKTDLLAVDVSQGDDVAGRGGHDEFVGGEGFGKGE